MVVAASPSPAPAPHDADGRPHPTYTKMITHALTELGGCSARPPIADHIAARFSGLPAAHDALVSAHLRRLVAEGVLRADGTDSPSYIFAPPEEKRRPGRPRKDSDSSTPVPTAPGEKRGRGRPRKSPQPSSEKATLSAHTGIVTPSLLPAKRKRGQSPMAPREDKPLQPGDDDSVTNGLPTTQEATEPIQAGGEARTFQNGGDTTPVQSEGASSSTGIKRGRGRPRKEKPSAAAAAMSPEPVTPPSTVGSKRGRGRPRKEKPSEVAMSPTAGAAVSRGFKRGCGRPSMERASAAAAAVSAETSMEKLAAAAAMYAETTSTGIQAGGGQSRMEKLAAAVAAMSAEGIKQGRGRPRKEKPSAAAGAKRSRGRPREDQYIGAGLVEAAYEAFFRDMMTDANTRREEEDLVSVEKMQTEKRVALGEDAAASTGIKRTCGRPRKKPAADDGVSTWVKRGRGRPRKEKPAAAATSAPETGHAVSTVVKRARGRPRKHQSIRNGFAEAAASTGVKRARGRPRKGQSIGTGFAEAAASTGVKRGRGRPRKNQSFGTGFVKAAGEVLFRDEAPGEKTQTEGATPGDRKETRVADDGCVPVSGENAAIGSGLGPANL